MTFSREDKLRFMRVMDQAAQNIGMDRFEQVDAIPDIEGTKARIRGRLDDGREMAWFKPDNKWFITRTGSAS